MNFKSLFLEKTNDKYIQQILDVFESKPNVTLMNMRDSLNEIFGKKSVDFVTSPLPAWFIKIGSKTLIIINKKYTDDADAILNNKYAIGYLS